MNVLLWVLAGVLAFVFLGSGVMKLVTPMDKIAERGADWVEKVPAWQVRLLGTLEVLGAVGLILPAVLDIAPVFVPLAALGVVVVMIGALIVHGLGREWPGVAMCVVLLAAAVLVVWGRLGPYSFTS
jgi:uncharacterized membrane protein YphA (DoxX/SURF4 family)